MATKTIGSSGKDYTTIASWLSSWVPSTLTEPEIAVCYDPQDTAQININKVTSAANYIQITAHSSARHAGVYDAGKCLLTWATGSGISIESGTDFVRIDGLQIYLTGGSGNCLATTGLTSSADIRWEQCILRGSSGTQGFKVSTGNAKIINCIIYNQGQSFFGNEIASSATTVHIYNCTFDSCYYALRSDAVSGNVYIKNCISNNSTNGSTPWRKDSGTWGSGTGYNSTDDGTATGGTGDRTGQTFTFVNEASDNFHLDAADAGARTYGTDLSADGGYAVSLDIDYETFGSPWNIGADQFSGSASAPKRALLMGVG